MTYRVGLELDRRLRDVQDHIIRIAERADTFRSLYFRMHWHSTRRSQRRSRTTDQEHFLVGRNPVHAHADRSHLLIGAIYGMNFDVMPELHWTFGYPFALALMALTGVGLWAVFKIRQWL